MSHADLILASASPRRAELLVQIGVRFMQLPADIDETVHSAESPDDYVSRMAVEKVQAGYGLQTGNLPVLGADTAVVCGGQIFGKPTDQDDAAYMLDQLSGATHEVLTAVAINQGDKMALRLSKTAVTFRTISASESLSYWQTGEPLGKAGGYAIQGMGAIFVTNIEGSYSGVVGLPIAQTEELLSLFNIPVWQTVKP